MLALCVSAAALAADWPQLESHTFRFKDPLNHNRRFIPLRLDNAPTKGSLAQFSYIDWRPDQREQDYPKLLEACRLAARPVSESFDVSSQAGESSVQLDNCDSNTLVSSQETSASHHTGQVRLARQSLHSNFHRGQDFRAAVIHSCSGSQTR